MRRFCWGWTSQKALYILNKEIKGDTKGNSGKRQKEMRCLHLE